ncbi:MAG: hypothetical protein IKT85_04325 [Kiritimatiellae bacterium]|nr:hypothetical protein [Kiritimatiellia bacterium]
MRNMHLFGGAESLPRIYSFTLERLIVVFRMSELAAYKAFVDAFEIYSWEGVRYKVTDFKWEPTNIISQMQLALGRWSEVAKGCARLYGTYTLEATEERISLEDLKSKYCERIRQTHSERRAARKIAVLQEVATFDELRVPLEISAYDDGGDNDLWLAVPLDPEAEVSVAYDEKTLEITAEGMGYDYDAQWPVNVYSLCNQTLFRMHEGPEAARPLTEADLEALVKLLVKNEALSLTAEAFKDCHSLLAILGVVFKEYGRYWC